jgi:hypothetical protein
LLAHAPRAAAMSPRTIILANFMMLCWLEILMRRTLPAAKRSLQSLPPFRLTPDALHARENLRHVGISGSLQYHSQNKTAARAPSTGGGSIFSNSFSEPQARPRYDPSSVFTLIRSPGLMNNGT